MTKQIEEYIKENLIGEAQTTALEFVAFLRSNNIEFYKDNGCNLCPEYPCAMLKDYQIKYVNKCNQIQEG